jgi:Heterokaryon incompatibility protein (HET)
MDTKDDSQSSDVLLTEPYCYEKRLEGRNIRLLQLEPDKDENVIQFRFLTKPLDQGVRYNSLSYTWGDPTAVQTILCEGKVLRVTQNLHEALTEYQKRGESAPLWADAICIYSHRTAMKHLGILRFAPQFLEGFNFTHSASQSGNTFFRVFRLKSIDTPCQFFDLIYCTYPCSETRQFSLRRRRSVNVTHL